METIIPLGSFECGLQQRQLFRHGKLWRKWYEDYPMLFDKDDFRIVKNQAKLGYHFYEWLGAIMLYHCMGYLVLLEKYEYQNHPRKKEIIELIDSELLDRVLENPRATSKSQLPDLLAYSVDCSDWFFCEAKGGKDKITQDQKSDFAKLARLTERPVRLIHFDLNRNL